VWSSRICFRSVAAGAFKTGAVKIGNLVTETAGKVFGLTLSGKEGKIFGTGNWFVVSISQFVILVCTRICCRS
jgi:hypothetical protein